MEKILPTLLKKWAGAVALCIWSQMHLHSSFLIGSWCVCAGLWLAESVRDSRARWLSSLVRLWSRRDVRERWWSNSTPSMTLMMTRWAQNRSEHVSICLNRFINHQIYYPWFGHAISLNLIQFVTTGWKQFCWSKTIKSSYNLKLIPWTVELHSSF